MLRRFLLRFLCERDRIIYLPSLTVINIDGFVCAYCKKAHKNPGAMTLEKYIEARFYFRGRSLLGILNTITACLFNRVLVKHVDVDTGRIVGLSVKRGTDFPK